MDKIISKDVKSRKDSTELHIEDKINNMLNQVMEERDSCDDSFEVDCKEIDDEFKLSRPSTRHQTQNMNDLSNINNSNNITQFISYPSGFNRANKRNMTHHMNQIQPSPLLVPLPNPQQYKIPRKSYCYSNYVSNNNLYPNFYNNSFNTNNTSSNIYPFGYNLNNLNLSNMSGLSNINNLNNSFQSIQSFNQSFNPQFNDNSFLNNNNLVGNNNNIMNNNINNNF